MNNNNSTNRNNSNSNNRNNGNTSNNGNTRTSNNTRTNMNTRNNGNKMYMLNHNTTNSNSNTIIPEDLVEPIDKLDTDFHNSILAILSNKSLKVAYNRYLNTVQGDILKQGIELYQTLNSDNFLNILQSIDMTESSKNRLKMIVQYIFKTVESEEQLALLLYVTINDFIINSLDSRIGNSKFVYKTAKNVQSSEDIESLGLKSMKSILNNFSNFRGFNKQSASKSIIFTAELSPNPETVNAVKARNTLKPSQRFYFKMFPYGVMNVENYTYNYKLYGLETETKMYSELFKLVKYGITPNILCKVVTGKFTDSYKDLMESDKLSDELKKNFKENMARINKSLHFEKTNEWRDIEMVITQPGGNLFDSKFKKLTPLERKTVMFQLLYTLYVFERLKISHGDLHSGNLFIVDVEPTTLCYLVEGVQYRFTTTKLLKIYDFDQSNISATTNIKVNNENITIDRVFNTLRSRHSTADIRFGKVEQFVRKADFIIFLANGINYLVPSYERFDFGEKMDPEFNMFMGSIMPGFISINHYVTHSYENIIENNIPSEIKELREVFLIPEEEAVTLDKLNIQRDIFDDPWNVYYRRLPRWKGCTIKDTSGDVSNNILIIPDRVLHPILKMLQNKYFEDLTSTIPIDITKTAVYTLDGRIL